jgi:hypothetical protein
MASRHDAAPRGRRCPPSTARSTARPVAWRAAPTCSPTPSTAGRT